jgi:hypothetical protein
VAWNVDRKKMYAHVYFDLDKDQLGIAVYAIGKVPGFSSSLSEDLIKETGTSRARDLFLQTLEEKNISPEELQLGKAFTLDQMQDKLDRLNILGKIVAKDPQAQIVADIDDPMFWAQMDANQLPKNKKAEYEKLSDQQKRSIGERLKNNATSALLTAETPEQLKEAMQKIYVSIARKVNPKLGPKEYASSKSSPPTFLISKEFNFAYYPGFRGAQYMSKVPSALQYVHPQHEKDKIVENDLKWYNILIPDTKDFTEGRALDQIKIEKLDYISEDLAQLFFRNLAGSGDKDLTIMDFNRSVEPVRSKAKRALSEISEQEASVPGLKIASTAIGTWIDLFTGKTYSSEQELLASKVELLKSLEQKREIPLAAKVKIYRLAGYFLGKQNHKVYSQLIKALKI